MQLAFTLKHHDWAYVERRGGIPLLTHLRSASERAEFRRTAIARAMDLFSVAEDEGLSDTEVGGLGLVVVQRALLAAEDLGGLLHALRAEHPWTDLRGTTIDRIDSAFEWVASEPAASLSAVFVLADEETFKAEGMADNDIALLMRLRQHVLRRWSVMLETSGALWFALREVAKATMHGFPIWAGSLVLDPPGAGEASDGLLRSPYGRSAFLMSSSEDANAVHIQTKRQSIRLDHAAVARYARSGRVAARLYAEVCEAHAESHMNGYAAGVPLRLSRLMNAADQDRLNLLVQAAATDHD